jgi:hypothetical protein
MVYDTHNYWGFVLGQSSGILKTLENTTFRKPDLFPSSGEGETPIPLGPLERANLSRCNTGRWTKSKAPVILNTLQIRHEIKHLFHYS